MVTTFGSARNSTNPSVSCLSFNTIERQGGKNDYYPSSLTFILTGGRAKIICRLHFNGPQKFLRLVDETGHYYRVDIDSIDDIYDYAEQLKATVHRYENTGQRYENPEDSQIVQNEDEQEYEVNDEKTI